MDFEYITTVRDAIHADGKRSECYAVVCEDGSAIALSIKDAIRLQQEYNLEYRHPHVVYPDDFTRWAGPDFRAEPSAREGAEPAMAAVGAA